MLRLRATVVKKVERDGLHGFSYTKSAGRFSGHATLSSLIKGSGTLRHQLFGRQYGVGHMGDQSVDQMG